MSNSRDENQLRISEIFFSLQGESRSVGVPTVFIRLTGCPLRCSYCDTSYAFQGGDWFSIDEIVQQVEKYATRFITVTGGEPLAQKGCLALLKTLCDLDYAVSLETSGALDISAVDKRVSRVVDLKTPASGEMEKNLYGNIEHLSSHDQLKFVICDLHDYGWAVAQLQQYNLSSRCEVLFSPCAGQLPAVDLANWILADQLPVRFQLQLHKILWGDRPGV